MFNKIISKYLAGSHFLYNSVLPGNQNGSQCQPQGRGPVFLTPADGHDDADKQWLKQPTPPHTHTPWPPR